MTSAVLTSLATPAGVRLTVNPVRQRCTACRPALGRKARTLHCRASSEDQQNPSGIQKLALPLTGALAAALLLGAISPDQALAARSGGRVGGSSFRSARPAPSAPRGGGSGPSIRQYNYNVAPPIVGGYGYGGYGYGGGFSLFPSFGVPIFGFGSFFNIIFFMFVASTVLSVVRGVLNRGRRNNDDDFDD